MDVLVVSKRCPKVVKLVMGFQHRSLKVRKFIMELHHRSPKNGETNVGALIWRLLHPYESLSNQLYKND